MNFIDRMFLLWHPTRRWPRSCRPGMVHFALVCFPLGMASYVNTFVAQYHGAGHPQRIGPAVWQGVPGRARLRPALLAADSRWPRGFFAGGPRTPLADQETLFFQTVAWGAEPKSSPRRCRRSSPAWASLGW